MFIRRLPVYGAVLVVGVGLALLARNHLAGLNVHDYRSRHRNPRPEVIVLSEHEFANYIEPAFAFRVDRTGEKPDVTFQAGTCLLARRAEEGRAPDILDVIVTEAVLAMWREPWMQDYSEQKFEQIRRQVEGQPGLDQDAILASYVRDLVAQPEFPARFRELLVAAAEHVRQPIRWETEALN